MLGYIFPGPRLPLPQGGVQQAGEVLLELLDGRAGTLAVPAWPLHLRRCASQEHLASWLPRAPWAPSHSGDLGPLSRQSEGESDIITQAMAGLTEGDSEG